MSNKRRSTDFHKKPLFERRWNGLVTSAPTIAESEHILNGQGLIHHANLAAHQEARDRVVKLIRALHIISEPVLESEIQIWNNLPRIPDRASRSNFRLIQRVAPQNTVTTTEWSFGQLPSHKETKHEVTQRTDGWILPFVLGGQPIAPKNLSKKFKEHDLIILRDNNAANNYELPPTYIGGMEKFDGGPRPGQNFSQVIATGPALAANERGGYFGDRAIDGLTQFRDLDDINNSRQKLWRIGNAVVARAQLLSPGGPNPLQPHLPPMPLVAVPPANPGGVVTLAHPYMLDQAPIIPQRPILHSKI